MNTNEIDVSPAGLARSRAARAALLAPPKKDMPTEEAVGISGSLEVTPINSINADYSKDAAETAASPRGQRSRQSGTSPPGATNAEWDAFAHLALEDLLPVVSDQSVEPSPNSQIRVFGKVPSIINGRGNAVGFTAWPSHHATQDDIARWRKDSRLGICLITRRIRALDVDISDARISGYVYDEIAKLGHKIPKRSRSNSGKFLLLFELPGDYTKRVIRCDDGLIEFLTSSQQCIVAGTHTSGARYEWKDGLPQKIPALTPEQFEGMWARLGDCFASDKDEPTTAPATAPRATVRDNAVMNDTVAQALEASKHVLSRERDGRLHITCPFASGHSTDTGDSATTYFPAFTGGYATGNFKCQHASCSHRTRGEFLAAFGIDPVGVAAPAASADDFDVSPVEGGRSQEKIIDIGDLLAKKFDPLNWVVPKVLPEGLFLLVSAPKIGKSWLAMQMVLAVATGGEVLGQRVQAGDALYLALEDNERRLQDRLRLLGADTAVRIGRAQFATEWPLSNEGGTNAIDGWLTEHPGARLVVVDVLERFRPRRRAKGNMYQEDYAAISALKQLSDEHRVAVLVIHHTRKGASDDPFATVSGTQALTGGADGTLILEKDRGESRGRLYLTGRDIKDDGEFVVEFEDCRWRMLGAAHEVASTFERQAILNALRAVAEPLSAAEVASATGRERTATSHLLKKMVRDGVVLKEGSKYWPAGREDLSDQGGGGNADDLA